MFLVMQFPHNSHETGTSNVNGNATDIRSRIYEILPAISLARTQKSQMENTSRNNQPSSYVLLLPFTRHSHQRETYSYRVTLVFV